jgi:hypothetical protein
MVPVTVAPVPILLLLSWRQLAKVSMLIPVVLVGPLAVVNDLFAIPDVIVAVVGVIDPVVMMSAGCAPCRTRQRGAQQAGTEKTRLVVHLYRISSIVDSLL